MTVTLISNDKTNNYLLTTSMPYSLTGQSIGKAMPTVAHLSYNLAAVDCNGLPQRVEVTSPYSGMGAITEVMYNDNSTEPAGAGTYAVTVNVAEGGNFTAAPGLLLGDFVISKIPLTAAHLSHNLAAVSYNGLPQAVSVTSSHTDGDITVKYGGNPIAPTNAGTYAITVDVTEGTNFAAATGLSLGDFTISKITPALSHLSYSLDSVDYSGAAHPVAVTPKSGYGGMGAITVMYDSSAAAPVNAGTYAVTVNVAEGANFTATAADLSPGSFTINKINPTLAHLSYSLATVEYNGSAQGVEVTTKPPYSNMGAITVKYDSSAAAPVNAGTYAVTLAIAGGANFNAAAADLSPGDFTIAPSQQAISFSPAGSLSVESGFYLLAAAASASGGAPAQPVLFRVDNPQLAEVRGDTLLPAQSGSITVTAYVPHNPNYADAPEVARVVALTSSSTAAAVEVIGAESVAAGSYLVSDPASKIVTVTVSPQDRGAGVIYGGAAAQGALAFTVNVSRGGTQQVAYTVESQDGLHRQSDTIRLEQRLDFKQYVRTKWDNTMMVNRWLLSAELYRLLACRWYEEGAHVATGLSYSKGGAPSDVFTPGLKYHFELETEEGLIRSTPRIFEETFPGGFHVYPNPLSSGETLYINANTEDGDANPEVRTVRVYSISGMLLLQAPLSGSHAAVPLLVPAGIYIVKVMNWQAKVVVN
jgi:hypothetical protein